MGDDAEDRTRNWIMTGWSILSALLIMALLFISIDATRDAETRADSGRYAVEPTGERMLY